MLYRGDTCDNEGIKWRHCLSCFRIALDYLSKYLGQFDSLPQDLIDILKINIVIASGPRLFFSKYFRHHFLMIDVSCPIEVKEFLLQEVGKYAYGFAFVLECCIIENRFTTQLYHSNSNLNSLIFRGLIRRNVNFILCYDFSIFIYLYHVPKMVFVG